MTEQQLQEMFEFYKRLEGAFPGYDFVDLLKQHRHTGNDFPQVEAGASVAGNDTEVQFNDGGVMGADAGLKYDTSTRTLTVGTSELLDARISYGGSASFYILGPGNSLIQLHDDGIKMAGGSGTNKGVMKFGNLTSERDFEWPNFGGTVAILVNAPSAANDNGTPGMIAYDSNYIYICVATDTWKRVAIATW